MSELTAPSAAAPPVLDPGVRRRDDGQLLIGGSPARLVRLSPAGSAALDRVLTGSPAPGDEALDRRLRDRGLLHPVALGRCAEVTFVIPVRNGGENLTTLVEHLREWGPVIVVDDGSSDGSAARASAAGARVVVNSTGVRGPGAARNVGLAAADSDFVAFIDADCVCPGDWARPLAGLLAADPALALAAPRVRSASGTGARARYERQRSPLDMGDRPALVVAGGRVRYVPSAALVGRRAALESLGGFDASLRFGEDVDLVWRALAAGWSVRYAPEVEIMHLPRSSAVAFARQRFDYGSSAADLDRRHPGAVSPLQLNRAGALILVGGVVGPRAAALAAIAHVASTAVRRKDSAAARPLALAATEGLLSSGKNLARALSRDWLPLTLFALASRRARPYAVAALVVDAASDSRRDPHLLLPTSLLLRSAENAAYAAGLWRGTLRQRSPRALFPRLGR